MRNHLKPVTVDAPQRSDEWYKARLGRVTASRVADTFVEISDLARATAIRKIMIVDRLTPQIKATSTFKHLWEMDQFELFKLAHMEIPETERRKNYRQGIVAERLTGLPADPDPYVTYDMKWGTVNEDIAKTLYQMEMRSAIDEAPLMLHPKLMAGASADGFTADTKTGEIGNIECKCLRSSNHLYKVIATQEVPPEYLPQIQMQLWITDNEWCDFLAYDSRLPEGLRLFIKRVERDEKYITDFLIPQVTYFLEQCDNDFKSFWANVKNKPKEKGVTQ